MAAPVADTMAGGKSRFREVVRLAAKGFFWLFVLLVFLFYAIVSLFVASSDTSLSTSLLCCGLVLALTFVLRLCARSEVFMEDVLKALLIWCLILLPLFLNDALVYLSCIFYPIELGWIGYGCAVEPIGISLWNPLFNPANALFMLAGLFNLLFLYYAFARPQALRSIRLIFVFICFAILLSQLHEFINTTNKFLGPYGVQHQEMIFLGRYRALIEYFTLVHWTDRLFSLPLPLLGVESLKIYEGYYSVLLWFFDSFTILLPDPGTELLALRLYDRDPAAHVYSPSSVGHLAAKFLSCIVMWVFWFVFVRRLVQGWLLPLLQRARGWWTHRFGK